MKVKPNVLFRLGQCVLCASLAVCHSAAYAQKPVQGQGIVRPQVTQEQMESLALDDQDLPNFVRTRPNGVVQGWTQEEQQSLFTGKPTPDMVRLNLDLAESWPARIGTYSNLRREIYSEDGTYEMDVVIWLCDSPDTARYELENFVQTRQVVYKPGSFSGASRLGDDSWVISDSPNNAMICRYGNMVVLVGGRASYVAGKNGISKVFPPQAVEAAVGTILLRGARQAKLTGIPVNAALVAVNGKPLGMGALMTGKQVYVPVAEFAKAMGMQSQWNAKTGALTLTGTKQKPITLTAGSMAGKVGTTTVALQTPVLKEAGQPVMTLQDLLTLTGGRITSRKGSVIAVKA